MVVFSNAKINIGLNIISKRPDNYHNIETIFYPVELCDVIEILPSETFKLSNYGHFIEGKTEENLCFKAFRLLKKLYSIPNVQIILNKNIPTGAGLGGGSSNAAFLLKALNEMFHINLTKEQLIKFSLQLGSDCPFFIYNKPLLATERGSSFKPVFLNLCDYYIVIVKDNIHISTSWAYSLIKPQKPKYDIIKVIENEPIDKWKNYLKNDFEEPIFKHYPTLKEIKNKLYNNGAIYASMTGSGSAIYAIYKQKPELYFSEKIFYWIGKLS